MSLTKQFKQIVEFFNPDYIEKVSNNPHFRRWFKNSEVVDSSGKPLVVFHGTYGDFTEFEIGDLGFHFGTDKSARERLQSRGLGGSEFGFKKTGAFFLSIQNPLFSHDAESWDEPSDVIEALSSSLYEGGFTKDDEEFLEKWEEYFKNSWNMSYTEKKEILEYIKEDLYKTYNIDGIIYDNDFEDRGSKSYIAFFPDQIKSIFNDGSFDINDNNFMS